MSRKITVQVELSIDATQGDFFTLFKEYLEREDAPFREDYGPDAWGGYDGPRVEAVSVSLVEDAPCGN